MDKIVCLHSVNETTEYLHENGAILYVAQMD